MHNDDDSETSSTVVDLDAYRQQSLFEHALLPPGFTEDDVRDAVSLRLTIIDGKSREALEAWRDIGVILLEFRASDQIPFGGWGRWVAANVSLGRAAASACVQLAIHWVSILPALEADKTEALQQNLDWSWPNSRDAIAIWKHRETRGSAETEQISKPRAARAAVGNKRDARVEEPSTTELQRLVRKQELEIHVLKARVNELTAENEDLRFKLASVNDVDR